MGFKIQAAHREARDIIGTYLCQKALRLRLGREVDDETAHEMRGARKRENVGQADETIVDISLGRKFRLIVFIVQ